MARLAPTAVCSLAVCMCAAKLWLSVSFSPDDVHLAGSQAEQRPSSPARRVQATREARFEPDFASGLARGEHAVVYLGSNHL